MSHQRLFLLPGFRLFAFFITSFYLSTSFGATVQSSATVSWAAAFAAPSVIYTSYRAGDDPSALVELASFGSAPSDAAPQSVPYGNLDNGASAFADSTSLLVESHATNGSAAIGASMAAVFLFSGSGLLTIEIPYVLTNLIQPGAGSSTVYIDASLDTIDVMGNTVAGPTLRETLDYTGLGSPNEATGLLSLEIAYNETHDAGSLNIYVSSESNAAPLKTVPIPALQPLFASRKKQLFKPQS